MYQIFTYMHIFYYCMFLLELYYILLLIKILILIKIFSQVCFYYVTLAQQVCGGDIFFTCRIRKNNCSYSSCVLLFLIFLLTPTTLFIALRFRLLECISQGFSTYVTVIRHLWCTVTRHTESFLHLDNTFYIVGK